jgi:hypothetical protein
MLEAAVCWFSSQDGYILKVYLEEAHHCATMLLEVA